MKSIMWGFLVVGVVVAALSQGKCIQPATYEHKVVNYVALGDSIAKGYGLDDVENQSYVGRVAHALEKEYGAVRLVNFGENGLRSQELLLALTDSSQSKYKEYRQALEQADIVTLSIGSNDLLQFLSRDTNIQEFRENGDTLFSEACEEFRSNIPQIIHVIAQLAPQAQLFVNTVYNPCKDVSFQIPEMIAENLDDLAEQYIGMLNDGFYTERVQSVFQQKNQKSRREKYVLVDVQTAFENSDEKLLNMVIRWGDIDPHPNAQGHRVIADLIIPKLALKTRMENKCK